MSTKKVKTSVLEYTYFDNNATVPMFSDAIKSYASVAGCGNPSSANPVASYWRGKANEFEAMLREGYGASESSHELIWTSGSTESNCTIVNMFTVNADGPRIIVCTTIEHKCLLEAVRQAEEHGTIVRWIEPMIDCTVDPLDIQDTLISLDSEYPGVKTLVCCMHANNETGAINDIAAIANVVDQFRGDRDIFLYTDCAQTAGKIPLSMTSIVHEDVAPLLLKMDTKLCVRVPCPDDQKKCKYVQLMKSLNGSLVSELNNYVHLGTITVASIDPTTKETVLFTVRTKLLVDGLCFSGHKVGGPTGIGILLVSRPFLENRSFVPITGAQNFGLRGGTYNMSGIIGLRESYIHCLVGHDNIMNMCKQGRAYILQTLANNGIDVIKYSDYITDPESVGPKALVYFQTGDLAMTLPGTLFCSIVYNNCSMQVCNVKLKSFFESRNIIVSIGSACNSAGSNISHVLKALGCPKMVALGILRISAYANGPDDYKKMARALLEAYQEIERLCIMKK